MGRWGQVEGGKQPPGPQRAVGRCPLSFPLPSTPLLRPSGPATHPELRILGSHTHTPWASFPILRARFFQAAALSPSRPSQTSASRCSRFSGPAGLGAGAWWKAKVALGLGLSATGYVFCPVPTTPSKPPTTSPWPSWRGVLKRGPLAIPHLGHQVSDFVQLGGRS